MRERALRISDSIAKRAAIYRSKLSDMTDSPFIWLYFSRVAKFRHDKTPRATKRPLAALLAAVRCCACALSKEN